MSVEGTYSDPQLMSKLTTFRMPFGKHSKSLLTDLPLGYLTWFSKAGFPKGELGQLMRIVHDVKSANMEHLFDNIRFLQTNHVTDSANNK